ncbi:MAG: CotH kinase family protein, partial [Verrucomicrobiales bacterium]
SPVYFTTPTPDEPNFSGAANPGPLITETQYTPAPPTGPSVNNDITVTCRVAAAFAPVANVSLTWRVMFTAAQEKPMLDDGQHGDGAAGDGVFGAVIPKSSYTQGQLVRWLVRATDAEGRLSRWPLFTNPTNSPEFLGTMIADSRVNTQLPVWYWFAATPAAANTRTGTRGAVFFNGVLSDNVFIRQRGAATSSGSRKFDFNTGHHAFISEAVGRVEEANINGTTSDPTLVRPAMAFETFRRTGHPAGIAFPLMLRVNAAADTAGGNGGLAYFVEQVDERLLDRVGLDRDGALYKFDQRSDLNPVFTDATDGVQKRTRLHENNADLQSVVVALRSSTPVAEREVFMFDNFDVGNMVNYLAVRAIINDSDDVRKNFYFYRDTNDSKEWMLIPWDKDWTFGIAGDGGQWWTHPFFGDQAHAKDNANQWSRLWDALHKNPRTSAMYLRRLRTLMDTMLQAPPPAPAGGYNFEKRADSWFAPLDPHTSQTVGSIKSWLPQRRNQLFVTFRDAPTNTNASRRIIPAETQNPSAVVAFGAIDPNPSSGLQEQEYVELMNPGDVAIDISGWRMTGGIDHTLRPGSVILPGSSLFLANKAAAFRTRTSGPRGGQGLFVQGDYDGSLSARGESLSLIDPRDPANPDDDRIVATATTPTQPTPAQRQLRVSELMFHPAPGGAFDKEEYEFIELVNIGESPLDLTGARFTNGISFTFSPASPVLSLAPGGRLVLVKNPTAFAQRYGNGLAVVGPYDGNLANGGERVRLVDAVGEEVLDFTYGDNWQPGTDGGGYSLLIRDESAGYDTWSSADRWRASLTTGGSPGAAEASPGFLFAPGDLTVTLNGSDAIIDFLGAPNKEYVLESSPDLSAWQLRTTLRTGADGRASATESGPPPGPRYYRVRVP